jgi:hypothetical protein
MMLSIFATIVSIVSGLVEICTKLFGKKADPMAQAVAVSNEVGHVSAQVSRDTADALSKDIQNANSQTDVAADAVRNAGSVREQQSAVDAAIDRANSPADPHG